MRVQRLLAVLALVALTGVGCTGSENPDPSASGSAGSSGAPSSGPSLSPEQVTAERLKQELLVGEEAPEPLTTVRGSLALLSGSVPVEVDVLAVQAGAESTLLRWRLRSGTGQPVRVYTSSLSRPNLFDTRGLAMLDASGNQRLQPFTYVQQAGTADNACVCSKLPVTVGQVGALMYALFPPLAPGATTVEVLIPGLPPATDVKVTR